MFYFVPFPLCIIYAVCEQQQIYPPQEAHSDRNKYFIQDAIKLNHGIHSLQRQCHI